MDGEAALVEQMTLMRIEMGVISTKIDNLNKLDAKLDTISKVSDHADQSATSAHKRLDDFNAHYDTEVKAMNIKIDTEMSKLISFLKWAIGLAASAVAISISLAALIWNITH